MFGNISYEAARFKATTAVTIQVRVFWVVTVCNAVVGHQHFRGLCCLHNPEELNLTLHCHQNLKSHSCSCGVVSISDLCGHSHINSICLYIIIGLCLWYCNLFRYKLPGGTERSTNRYLCHE